MSEEEQRLVETYVYDVKIKKYVCVPKVMVIQKSTKTVAPKKKKAKKFNKKDKLKPIVLQKSNTDIGMSKNASKILPKKKGKRKTRHRKLQNKIQKLFHDLRESASGSVLDASSINEDPNESQDVSECCSRISVSDNVTVINLEETDIGPKQQNTIIIADDDDVLVIDKPCTPRKSITGPTHSSTPITLKKRSSNNNCTTQNFNAQDKTRVINDASFLTVDLTTESLNKTENEQVTVIDLDKTTDTQDCTFVSMSNTSLSMSGDSDVTVLRRPQQSTEKQMRKFVKGIAKMDASEKGKLLEMITQNIFNGCAVPVKVSMPVAKATETEEDAYIKEVILGQKASCNSIGSNIYNPERGIKSKSGLRMIVIDGSNVAMGHGRHQFFSVEGLKICIDYFVKRGHVVKAFVPQFRCKFNKCSNPRLLDSLERRGLVIYTPSREVQGRSITPYDDRYIVQCAAEFDGVIVSGDFYRDLMGENAKWKYIIENSLLQYTWVNDMIMFPKDPLGRNGPTLEQFLRHPL